jgi:hypothetical protein
MPVPTGGPTWRGASTGGNPPPPPPTGDRALDGGSGGPYGGAGGPMPVPTGGPGWHLGGDQRGPGGGPMPMPLTQPWNYATTGNSGRPDIQGWLNASHAVQSSLSPYGGAPATNGGGMPIGDQRGPGGGPMPMPMAPNDNPNFRHPQPLPLGPMHQWATNPAWHGGLFQPGGVHRLNGQPLWQPGQFLQNHNLDEYRNQMNPALLNYLRTR